MNFVYVMLNDIPVNGGLVQLHQDLICSRKAPSRKGIKK